MRYHGADYAEDVWDKRIAKAIKARFLITTFCHSFAKPLVNIGILTANLCFALSKNLFIKNSSTQGDEFFRDFWCRG